jgi:hypothetical protein
MNSVQIIEERTDETCGQTGELIFLGLVAVVAHIFIKNKSIDARSMFSQA